MKVGDFLKSINMGTAISVIAAVASVYSAFQANAILQEQNQLLIKQGSADIQVVRGNELFDDYLSAMSARVCFMGASFPTTEFSTFRGYFLYYFASSQVTVSNVGGRSVALLDVEVSEPGHYFLGEVYERGKADRLSLPITIPPGESKAWLLAGSELRRLTPYTPVSLLEPTYHDALSELSRWSEWQPSLITWTLRFGDGRTLDVKTRTSVGGLHTEASTELQQALASNWSIDCNDRLAIMRSVWSSSP
jgi:hypothetical protein